MTAYSDGDFVKKCPINVAQEIYPKMMSEIQKISLSRWTVAKCIDVLTDDICVTLKDKVKNFVSWSFAANESTDTEQLAIYVKGVGKESNDIKELLSLLSIKSTTTGADIFTEVFNAFETFGMDLTILCRIATDGGPAVSRPGIGLVGLLKYALREKGISDNNTIFHCIIQQKNLLKLLKFNQIGPVTKAVNFIRARKLNYLQFQKLLQVLNSALQDFLYFVEVRWLSKVRMLRQFFNLGEEVIHF